MAVHSMPSQGNDVRLIEAGFPCHQVGAETRRERGASSALPPLYYLHVWWARRPLTPSRAAVLGSLLPADTDVDWFLRELGIEQVQADVNGVRWVLTGTLVERVVTLPSGEAVLPVDSVVLRALQKEQERRQKNRATIERLIAAEASLRSHPVVIRWADDSRPLPEPFPSEGTYLHVYRVAADPAHVNERIDFARNEAVQALGRAIQWDPEDLYGYSRAYQHHPTRTREPKVVLDPTAGGGSIPFEALRLGHKVIANDLNPVAAVILHATLDYPARFGADLVSDIERWGKRLVSHVESEMRDVTPFSPLPPEERERLRQHCRHCPDLVKEFDVPESDQIGLLYARQVTCPHCGGEAPLLNTCWLSKTGEKWGVRIVTDGKPRGGKVYFEPYRILKGNKGPNGEDPNEATVSGGVGTCVHCRQAISADEIKAQARGESPHGKWKDRLYCVVAVRYQPKLDKNGQPERYRSGDRAGEIKTEKVRFFRAPNDRDLEALEEAERRLNERWPEWEAQGLIPTERIPEGNDMRPIIYGMPRWCDMFTPRQLLGHLILIEELNRLKPQIIAEHGEERGRAIVTYLQFAVDKGLDYNSKQTRWEYTRSVIKGTFGRHDFSLKWTFGEMIFTGPASGAAWGLYQVIEAYKSLAELLVPLSKPFDGKRSQVHISCTTAASLEIPDKSVDLICMDPPYYNNVQYAELSDYFYVWQRRTLNDLYPGYFQRRLTNKQDEAVANPARDGSTRAATEAYEDMMREIFTECFRVLKDDGVLTVMFTHKTQEAWEALTRSLIESGWTITSSMPVESESAASTHQMNMAAAASSIFITCRKRDVENRRPATWSGFGGTGVAQRVREAVREGLKEFEALNLNPVDEMVASYGRALRVLSENWPVYDGDEMVSPRRAMDEASAVVAHYQMERLTQGRLRVEDLKSEAAMAVTLFGIFGLQQFPYDDALNLSRSLGIRLEARQAGYTVQEDMIGINTERTGRRGARSDDGEITYHAPLVRSGSKLRLALPEERHPVRLEKPQTEWDVLQGTIMAYREGDIPVARAYLEQHAGGHTQLIMDLLAVWAQHVGDQDLRKEADALLFGLR